MRQEDAGELRFEDGGTGAITCSLWSSTLLRIAARVEGQLRAFAGAVLRGEPLATGTDDAVKNMRVIDAVYRAAGLPLRGQR